MNDRSMQTVPELRGYPAPEVQPPAVAGQRYEAVVPDSLDLADRAARAIHGIGGCIDPELDYQQWFSVRYAANPPVMRHHGADPTCDPFFAQALPLLRTMSGSTDHLDMEVGLMGHLLRDTSPEDGLYYNIYRPNRPWHSNYGHPDRPVIKEDFSNIAGVQLMLGAMLNWRERDGDPVWDARIRAMADGLRKIAIYRDDYAYYPDGGFAEVCSYPRSGWLNTDEPTCDNQGAEGSITCYYGDAMRVLPRWYLESGDEQALDLARRLARFCMRPAFWGGNPEPVMVAGSQLAHFNYHAHARLLTLVGMLEYARVAGDARVLEFVQRGYEFAMTLGIPRIGWISAPYWGSGSAGLVEGCTLYDLVTLGIRLADAGAGDYWDVVDGVVRNHLMEQQLVRADLLQRVAEAGPAHREREVGECDDNVIQRSLGVFGVAGSPTGLPNARVIQCCTGNASLALYYAWEGALRHHDGTVTVNLLLNRASRWLDVDSYLPYQGRVAMTVKEPLRVAVRIASWIPRRELQTRVGGAPRDGTWVGNYLMFDGLKPGEVLTLQFPISESTVAYVANAHRPSMGYDERERVYASSGTAPGRCGPCGAVDNNHDSL